MTLLSVEQGRVLRNGNAIVDGVSLELAAGEVVGLIGPNGAGKSTLLRAMLGLIDLDAGRCLLQGRELRHWPIRERARRMAYLPQDAESHWPLSVSRVIAMGRLPHLAYWQRSGAVDREAIARAVKLTEIEDLLDRVVTTLSGGERMRVNLARLLASEAPLLLADEPIASLDPYHQFHIMEIFAEHARAGGCVLVVLHDLNYAARFCDRLVLLDAGKRVAEGLPREVLQPEQLRRVYGVDTRWIETGDISFILAIGRYRRHH
jgi:iron complex transport system ATP-binding protein